MSITNRNLDQQLEYTYKQIDIDVSATIDRFEINLVGRELYYESGDIDLRIYFQDKSRGFITLQPLRRITFADNKAFTRVIVETTTTSSTKSTLVVTSGDLIIQDYTAEISGTSNININQISGDSNIVSDGYFNITKSLGSTKGSVNLSGSTTGTATLFTVPANFRFLITSVQIACDTSSNSVLARLQLEDTSGNASILSAIVQHSSLLGSCNATFPLPVIANATDTLVMVDGGGSATPTFMVAGNLVSV